jgi:hypothetical protein
MNYRSLHGAVKTLRGEVKTRFSEKNGTIFFSTARQLPSLQIYTLTAASGDSERQAPRRSSRDDGRPGI